MGREERGVNGGVKKLGGGDRWCGGEHLENGYREEIGLRMINTGHRELL